MATTPHKQSAGSRALAKLRKTQTTYEIAKVSRTHQPAIVNYTSGRTKPSQKTRLKLAKHFGIQPDAWDRAR